MRTLLIGVLLTVSSFGATAQAQTETMFSLQNEPKINFDVTVNTRARFVFELKIPTYVGDQRYRFPSDQRDFRLRDTCVIDRQWVMVTPFQDCSHPSLRRARPVIRFIYVF